MSDVERIRQRLLEVMDTRGLSLREVAELAGLSHATIENIKSASKKRPSTVTLRKLAPVLGVDEDRLLEWGGHRQPTGTAPTLRTITGLATELAVRARELERRAAELEERHGLALYETPVVGELAAGPGRTIMEAGEVAFWGSRRVDRLPGNLQAFWVVGDCLTGEEPDIHDGDLVLVDGDVEWRVGQVIAIRMDGGCQVKKLVRRDGSLHLQSRHGLAKVPEEDSTLIGVVMSFQRPLRW